MEMVIRMKKKDKGSERVKRKKKEGKRKMRERDTGREIKER